MSSVRLLDSLYGDIGFDDDVRALLASPVIQRLRHVRLSNIDSVNMPGIANLSRFEHVVGVGYLITRLGLFPSLRRRDRLTLVASGLLHDWAITAFGHLVEEAFNYVGAEFNHERRFYEIVAGKGEDEIGGVERQIFEGRETGLLDWSRRVSGPESVDDVLRAIGDHILGRGQFGRLIRGDIDLDNIDGVFRMACHMGLRPDPQCPLRLAAAIVSVDCNCRDPVFKQSSERDLLAWINTRHAVYDRLMLAQGDFAGKLMILYATIRALQAGELGTPDWNLSDDQLVGRLCQSPVDEARETVKRWRVGELWDTIPLRWMAGGRPDFPGLFAFSQDLTATLGRRSFAYGIKDKRVRSLTIRFENGETKEFGVEPGQWLLGVGSPVRRRFTRSDIQLITEMAEQTFHTSMISAVSEDSSGDKKGDAQPCLL